MTDQSKILEGVFAISKPPSLSSAQVLRDLQNHFATSKTFAPLLLETRRRQDEQDRHKHKRRRRDNDQVFKMGHGGTLDPLATGVLIVGIGRGTKTLQDFLGCTKQYDTVVLFGKSTDTYDICGKIVSERSFEHITQSQVEEKLASFRGEIKQVPPVYSALKINGVKAYEYARSGKELPRELESRDMKVDECTLIEYYEGGNHAFRWPAAEASDEEKAAVQKLMNRGPVTAAVDESAKPADDTPSAPATSEPTDTSAPAEVIQEKLAATSPAAREPKININSLDPSTKAALHTHALPTLSSTPVSAPAARIRLQVSSGFYVRSFAHDLGLLLSSHGTMAELIRTRQQNYTIISPAPEGQTTALTYADLEAGEDVWGPKVTAMLKGWMECNPAPEEGSRVDDRDRSDRRENYRGKFGCGGGGGRGNRGRQDWKGARNGGRGDGDRGRRNGYGRDGGDRSEKRRNSSSPE